MLLEITAALFMTVPEITPEFTVTVKMIEPLALSLKVTAVQTIL
jgi:hypothetical protein